ncbi:LysR family transcriptional regulator [Catenuloplanes japonicus]|uniref:LysR family transcriptional regulator n=1 Tax=Catenuloplanes japonicus TaxID=33876 RepID=UPI0005243AFC|nr:LysR family transcriptional regulator [Catenuloplanes japonicus]
MDDRKLECFVAVAEELNFTRAAQRLYATQSTVSAALRSLEEELGASLFTRTTRSVTLTEAGAAFLPEARAAIEALDRARAAVAPETAGLRGSLTIGTLHSITTVDVPALAGEFHRRHPGVRLRVEISARGAAGHIERVKAGFLDLALVSDAENEPGVQVTPLRVVPLALFVPSSHRLAARSVVSIADLAGERFIDLPAGFGQRTAVDRAFAEAGVHRDLCVETMEIAAVAQYIHHGLGIGFLPAGYTTQLPTVRIRGVTLGWTLSAATAAGRGRSRAAQELIALLPAHTRTDTPF